MSLREKTFVITGANTGIGRANALALAERGAGRLIVAARTLERTEPVLAEVRAKNPEGQVDFVQLDLGDLASVRRAADEILAKDVTVDVLINNAGLAGVQGGSITRRSGRSARRRSRVTWRCKTSSRHAATSMSLRSSEALAQTPFFLNQSSVFFHASSAAALS